MLAGGIDESKNSGKALSILSVSGEKQDRSRVIQPEDSIVVAQNSFLYYFNEAAPVITALVSIATLVVAIMP